MDEIKIYKTPDGNTEVNVRFDKDTVWLSQAQLVELFQSSKANISEHLKNIFKSGELDEGATVRNFRTVRQEGNRDVMTFFRLKSTLILNAVYLMPSNGIRK